MTNTPIAAKLAEASRPFAAIKADDNDDFSRYDNDVVLRVEIMAGEIKALREALAEYDTAKWAEPPSPAGEPVAWQKRHANDEGWSMWTDCSDEVAKMLNADRDRYMAWETRALYAAPQPPRAAPEEG